MLQINNITYTYEQNDIHTRYDFTGSVAQNEIVGVIGHSGSGKSTFLDLIAGFLEPQSGTILFEGQDISRQEPQKRPLTILFQKYNTFEHLSVIKNVLLGITSSLKPKSEDIHEAKTILKEVKLEGFEDKITASLSGGQSQRVALARSLIRRKPILLLDEPFSGLDLETRIKMLDLVKNISQKRQLHTIMITHDLQDCKRIADRVYKVEKGQLKPFDYEQN
ncbi:thiamine ABC transporter ATP-binding protein [Sulfurospirillum sp. 1612]|uniref:thiamine ABC transporter ATP-binding protein n=1 Tax=Sulfurospirillum sp. 1612 TaxID=3094835 RepID=UPI002F94ED86